MECSNFNIIFDLDGTLVHSIPDMHNAINKTLTEYSLENISEEKLQTFVGEGMLSLSKKLLIIVVVIRICMKPYLTVTDRIILKSLINTVL